ncbi:FIST signal transduction protein [Flammeovirga kamogawensis]|uniref:FIST C-terminal domain-containing protein n=1 Tax=Flammeovirga kamogawensis TaxID=373891 RepID=A0ABX8GVI0_9BACT|nr:FIST C-terminal domain-containing protein [Flammeovirga kamogawensis]MBB6459615.1 hypothetical protein [Flammeovirga kamogawensis]QWG07322.1 FIST C-terminal domain-containing protein [Flammeovirga kamogawensis]TRX69139.1 hypothetical protein EO216_13760 [Flammeovirga kamogawensis]
MLFLETNASAILSTLKKDHKNKDLYIFLVSESSAELIPQLISLFNQNNMTCFGGIFPSLISGTERINQGLIVKKYTLKDGPYIVKNDNNLKYESISNSAKSCFLFIDGLSENIVSIIENIYNQLGSKYDYFGGGCGTIPLKKAPSVFTNQGFFSDCAILCFVEEDFHLGIQHGWERVYGPIIATKTEKKYIEEFNWENATEFYKNVLEELTGEKVNNENFIPLAQAYPIGISKEGHEDIIRDPIEITANGAVKFPCHVLENSVLYLMKSNSEQIINSAKEATKLAVSNIDSDQEIEPFIMDCFSRASFLSENYTAPLKQTNELLIDTFNTIKLEGALSLGEISSYENGQYIEFFNKTFVINAISKFKK